MTGTADPRDELIGELRADVTILQARLEVLEKKSGGGFDGRAFGEAVVCEVKQFVERKVDRIDTDLGDRIDGALRAINEGRDRLKAIEERPTLKYLGPWVAGKLYAKGELVTSGGSLWHCSSPCATLPSAGDECWTMAARRGRDGKAAQP